MTIFRIGTRRSPLALWQTNAVVEQLRQLYPAAQFDLVHFTTTGDRILDKPLPEIGGKGAFTEELEKALATGEIDMAVHSLKDLPTLMPEPFTLGAILQRGNPFDAFISRSHKRVAELPNGAVVGTSSLRRSAQLLHLQPDLQITSLRGNVDTRLKKALDPDGPYDAIILAATGVERLGQENVIGEVLDPEIMLPAPGQGAIAVQCRANDPKLLLILQPLDDAPTRAATLAERAFLRQLEAGCKLPIAAYATIEGDQVNLTGRVSGLKGENTITVRGQAALSEAQALGTRLAQQAIEQGAGALIAAIKKGSSA